MLSEPNWLPLAEVIKTNQEVVEVTDEPHLILDLNGLEAALARPLQHWYYDGEADMLVLAVKLLLGIAQKQCFQQGNKRTALLSAVSFLEANGYELDIPNHKIYGELIRRVIIGEMTEEALTAIFAERLAGLPDQEEEAEED